MTAPAADDLGVSETDREAILAILEEAIHDVRNQATNHESDTLEDEQMQIKWYRTLGTLAGQYRMLQRDTDIDEMEAELELLQKATNSDSQGGRR